MNAGPLGSRPHTGAPLSGASDGNQTKKYTEAS